MAWGTIVVSAIFSLIGLFVFIYGFNRLRKYGLIQDIPRSKIRSLAMGLVEIHGQVKAKDFLLSPFSQSKCVYYRYEIQEYRRHTHVDSKGHTHTSYSWDTIAGGEKRIPFWAKDETGEVYVEPQRAEFNLSLKKLYLQKAGSFGSLTSFLKSLKMQKKLNPSALKLVPLDPKKKIFFNGRVGDRRFYEYFLEPEENLFVMGTAARQGQKVLIKQGKNEPTFIISNRSEKDLLRSLKWQMIASFIFGGFFFLTGIFIILTQLQVL